MNEAIELLEQGDNVLAESEVAVATGEQLLSEAMELYLVSCYDNDVMITFHCVYYRTPPSHCLRPWSCWTG